jgi:Uma2 family endonuclease
MARADDGWRYELVEGRLVRMPPTGFEHGSIAVNLLTALQSFARERELGGVSPPETGFLLSREGEPDTVLPGFSFPVASLFR